MQGGEHPTVVETALPPVKRRKIENVWPMIPHAPISIRTGIAKSGQRLLPTRMPTAPFTASRTKTTAPHPGPRARVKLVVPIFPLPIHCMLMPLSSLTDQTPNGSDPMM
jgi:hypothetical protein